MKKFVSEQQVLSVAWVIMPDHLHWLFQSTSNNSLSKVIKTLKGRSSRVINQQNDKIQFLWQRGFHDHCIRTEENLIQVARYIIANPLRAGLVERVGDYPFWDTLYL